MPNNGRSLRAIDRRHVRRQRRVVRRNVAGTHQDQASDVRRKRGPDNDGPDSSDDVDEVNW
jgi:hypothetical protein